MTRLSNSIKKSIKKYYKVYMFFYLPLMPLEMLVFAVLIHLKHLLFKPISG